MMREIKNNLDDTKKDVGNGQIFNPDKHFDIQSKTSEIMAGERYDPDKRIENGLFESETVENKLSQIEESIEKVNEKLSDKSLKDIVAESFNVFIENVRETSLDTLAVASGYVTACKLASLDITEGNEEKQDNKSHQENIKDALTTFFSAPELANKFIQEYGVGPDKLKEAIGETVEFVLELGKAIWYINTRGTFGVLSILDNASRAVYSMGLYALGKSDIAKDVMTDSKLNEVREYLDQVVKPNEVEKKIGDIADKANGIVGELALAIIGAIGIAEASPIVVAGVLASAALVGFNEAGKNLGKNIEKSGEYGKKEFVSALVTTGLAITVERVLPCIQKIAKTENIYKAADKVSSFAKGNMDLGSKLTKSIITSLQASAGMAVFKGAAEIQKVVDYNLGITDSIDAKKEVLETAGFILGAGALGGGLSFAADTLVKSKGFQEIVKKINKDIVFNESEYDIIYKHVEYTKEYLNDLLDKSTLPDTIPKDLLNPENFYKKPSDLVGQTRAEFKKTKDKLIKEWEQNTGESWPRYAKDLTIKLKDGTEKIIRKAGQLYDAHHINPLTLGGENTWNNLTPLSADVHFDSRGVHRVNGALDKLTKLMEGLL